MSFPISLYDICFHFSISISIWFLFYTHLYTLNIHMFSSLFSTLFIYVFCMIKSTLFSILFPYYWDMLWLFQFIVSFILPYISSVSSYKVFIEINWAKLWLIYFMWKFFLLLKIHLFIFCYVRLFYISCVYLYRGWLIENVCYVMNKNPEYNE